MLKYLLIMVVITACSSQEPKRLPSSTPYQKTWQEYLNVNFIDKHGLQKFFPDPQYMKPWQPDSDFVLNNPPPPYRVQEKAFSCPVKKLYPTHPSQMTKEYLHAVYSMYDHAKLPPTSYACLTKSTTNRFCLRGATAIMAVMSDIYEDECGNYYRGYWLVTYLKSDENMGTLFAKGRVAFPRPGSEFKNDYVEDGTYSVPEKDFMFFGELLPGDLNNARAEKARSLRSGFKMNGKLFVR